MFKWLFSCWTNEHWSQQRYVHSYLIHICQRSSGFHIFFGYYIGIHTGMTHWFCSPFIWNIFEQFYLNEFFCCCPNFIYLYIESILIFVFCRFAIFSDTHRHWSIMKITLFVIDQKIYIKCVIIFANVPSIGICIAKIQHKWIHIAYEKK